MTAATYNSLSDYARSMGGRKQRLAAGFRLFSQFGFELPVISQRETRSSTRLSGSIRLESTLAGLRLPISFVLITMVSSWRERDLSIPQPSQHIRASTRRAPMW
jgi:hypothetical protein